SLAKAAASPNVCTSVFPAVSMLAVPMSAVPMSARRTARGFNALAPLHGVGALAAVFGLDAGTRAFAGVVSGAGGAVVLVVAAFAGSGAERLRAAATASALPPRFSSISACIACLE